jgi:hypothetical protein
MKEQKQAKRRYSDTEVYGTQKRESYAWRREPRTSLSDPSLIEYHISNHSIRDSWELDLLWNIDIFKWRFSLICDFFCQNIITLYYMFSSYLAVVIGATAGCLTIVVMVVGLFLWIRR